MIQSCTAAAGRAVSCVVCLNLLFALRPSLDGSSPSSRRSESGCKKEEEDGHGAFAIARNLVLFSSAFISSISEERFMVPSMVARCSAFVSNMKPSPAFPVIVTISYELST